MSVAGERDDLVADEIADLQPNLRRFARSLTGDAEEAADLTQEATVRALGARGSFTPGTNLKAWLFRILRNVHLNRGRYARLHTTPLSIDHASVPLASTAAALRPLEHEVLVRAELSAVVRAFRDLPESLRVPLYLTAVEGMSYAEVARRLEVPIGTVMSRVHRARHRLLARLAEQWE
jgi:RNA polymerase sigma-70 factor (ECF subfamily)